MAAKPLPSAEYLRRRFAYDQSTGILLWRRRPAAHFSNERRHATWNARCAGKPAGWLMQKGYIQLTLDGDIFTAHRIAWKMMHGEPVPREIDHIDGNRANNRISNLRAATHAENIANSRLTKLGNSGVRGVHFERRTGRFAAHITHLQKQYHLGRFDTLEEAAAARREAATRLYGEFARHE